MREVVIFCAATAAFALLVWHAAGDGSIGCRAAPGGVDELFALRCPQ